MKEINTGGAAFPTKNPQKDRRNQVIIYEEGMTLRDYFAAKALQGTATHEITSSVKSMEELGELLAIGAYTIADAMIKEKG